MSYTDEVDMEENSYENGDRGEYLKVLDSTGRLARDACGKAVNEFKELFR